MYPFAGVRLKNGVCCASVTPRHYTHALCACKYRAHFYHFRQNCLKCLTRKKLCRLCRSSTKNQNGWRMLQNNANDVWFCEKCGKTPHHHSPSLERCRAAAGWSFVEPPLPLHRGEWPPRHFAAQNATPPQEGNVHNNCQRFSWRFCTCPMVDLRTKIEFRKTKSRRRRRIRRSPWTLKWGMTRDSL